MIRLRDVLLAAVLSAAAMAWTATSASAHIVCNAEGDCWHVHGDYDYPATARVEVHPDTWAWEEGEQRRWREHPGEERGYWSGGDWHGF